MLNEIIFETEKGRKSVKKIGPGFWGYIYRPEKEPFCYRFIPIEEVRAIECREEIKRLIGQPRLRGIAPVKDVFQSDISGKVHLIIQYEIITPDFWIDIIKHNDARVNLLYFIEILKILPFWWSQLGQGIIPLPSEIVFSDNTPFILQMPISELPAIKSFLDENERAEYLAPEYFRMIKGTRMVNGRNLDIYALGVAIHKGLHLENEQNRDNDYIKKMANGSFPELRPNQKKLPLWCEKVVQIRSIYNYVHQLMSRDIKFRSYYEPDKLSSMLVENIKYFDPATAIGKFRKEGKTEMAYGLIKEILATDLSSDNLIMASEIARDLNLIFEAIEHLEEAINKFPGANDKSAYIKQLELLIRRTPELILESVIKKKTQLFEKIEGMIERDYEILSFDIQEEFVEEVITFFLMRGKYDKAALFLYPHLYDAGKTFLWWKFERTIAYSSCLVGQKRIEDARKLISGIKEKLKKVESEGRLHPELIKNHRKSLLEIEKKIFEQDLQSKNLTK